MSELIPQNPFLQCPFCEEFLHVNDLAEVMHLRHVDDPHGFTDEYVVSVCPSCGACFQMDVHYSLSLVTTRQEVDL